MLSNLKTTAFVAVMGLGLSACTSLYDTAKTSAPAGDAYEQALYKNYMTLADSERREEDWSDANFFGGKALAATNGVTGPQELSERMLTSANLAMLSPARDSLTAALAGGAANASPEAAAMAVAGFDCWMQEAEENHQPDDIAACKQTFENGMAGLEPASMPMMVDSGPWTVYFALNSDNVDGNGQAPISAAAENAMKASDAPLIVSGHTDTSGPAQYNLGLSARRAEAVVDILGQLGIDASRINVSATGEEDLAVPTADGVVESANRRVEIRLLN
mgnify:CR=1 FL=1